jgi:hypothetical protein
VQPVGPSRIVVRPYQELTADQKWSDINPVATTDLPLGTGMKDYQWSLCFNASGFSNQEATIRFQNEAGQLREIKLLYGGASTIIRKL